MLLSSWSGFLLLAREKSPDFLTRRPLYVKTHGFRFVSATITTANDNDLGRIRMGGKVKVKVKCKALSRVQLSVVSSAQSCPALSRAQRSVVPSSQSCPALSRVQLFASR